MLQSINLSNLKWQLLPCPPSNLLPDVRNAIDATVPGGILLDLQRAGLIEDPFYAENFRSCAWCDQWTYWYRCQLTAAQLDISKPEFGQKFELLFEGIDTFGEVFLNGVSLGEVHNMFCRHSLDVTEQLDFSSENILEIRIDPVMASTRKWTKQNKIDDSQKWMSFDIKERIAVRKMQMSFGWDNSPYLLTGGLFRPVKLVKHNAYKLENIRWHVEHLNVKAQTATLCVQGVVAADLLPSVAGLAVAVKGCCRDHQFAGNAKVKADGSWKTHIKIDHPYLWWPATLGAADQYQTGISLVGEKGEMLDQYDLKIGIRTIEIVTQPAVPQLVSQVTGNHDASLKMDGGDAGSWAHIPLDPPELIDVYPFHLMVNGVMVFIRGANWQTSDVIPGRVNKQQVETLLDAAVVANINMIRLWGGGTVEPDCFYQRCSDLGLLVWQDFYFACAQYPQEKAFLDEVEVEVEDIVKRLRNHTCIACWCGGNESEMIDYDRQIDYTNDPINRGILIKSLAKYDSQKRYYHPSTPSSFPSDNPDPRQDCAGDRRNWGPWHPDNNYEHIRQDISRVISEGGMYAWPSRATFDQFMPKQLQWPVEHRTSRLHCGDLDFYDRGFLDMTLKACRFFEEPKDIDHLIEVSQFAQGWGLKMLIERCRQRRPECGGVILWKLNDAWPCVDAGLLDYGLVPRTSLGMVRDAYAPVAVSLSQGDQHQSKEAHVWLVNDLMIPMEGELTLEVATFDTAANGPVITKTLKSSIEMPAGKSLCALTISTQDLDLQTAVLIARFDADDPQYHSQTFYTFKPVVAWQYWQYLKRYAQAELPSVAVV